MQQSVCAALGKQDYAGQLLTPLQPGVEVLGSSSDHLLLDVSEAEENLKLGDIVRFIPDYRSRWLFAQAATRLKRYYGSGGVDFRNK